MNWNHKEKGVKPKDHHKGEPSCVECACGYVPVKNAEEECGNGFDCHKRHNDEACQFCVRCFVIDKMIDTDFLKERVMHNLHEPNDACHREGCEEVRDGDERHIFLGCPRAFGTRQMLVWL